MSSNAAVVRSVKSMNNGRKESTSLSPVSLCCTNLNLWCFVDPTQSDNMKATRPYEQTNCSSCSTFKQAAIRRLQSMETVPQASNLNARDFFCVLINNYLKGEFVSWFQSVATMCMRRRFDNFVPTTNLFTANSQLPRVPNIHVISTDTDLVFVKTTR